MSPAGRGVCVQPATGSHASTMHAACELQSRAGPGWHTPLTHASVVVQALPSVHAAPLGSGVLTRPTAGSHVTVWHCVLVTTTAAPTQCPAPSQLSPVVHALPSEHVVPAARGVCTHPDAVHAAVVHEPVGTHDAAVHAGLVSTGASIGASFRASFAASTAPPAASAPASWHAPTSVSVTIAAATVSSSTSRSTSSARTTLPASTLLEQETSSARSLGLPPPPL